MFLCVVPQQTHENGLKGQCYVCKECRFIFIGEFLGRIVLYFKQIFMELFNHLLLKELMLGYLQDLQKMKTNHKFVKNLKFSLFSHFVAKNILKITMAKDIVYILVIFQSVENFRKVVKS
jgi:hypothetical protein